MNGVTGYHSELHEQLEREKDESVNKCKMKEAEIISMHPSKLSKAKDWSKVTKSYFGYSGWKLEQISQEREKEAKQFETMVVEEERLKK